MIYAIPSVMWQYYITISAKNRLKDTGGGNMKQLIVSDKVQKEMLTDFMISH